MPGDLSGRLDGIFSETYARAEAAKRAQVPPAHPSRGNPAAPRTRVPPKPGGRWKRHKLHAPFCVRLPAIMFRILDRLAFMWSCSRAEITRRALADYALDHGIKPMVDKLE